MTWKPKRRSLVLEPGIWREYLTPDEAERVRHIEARMTKVDAERRQLSAEMGPIRNRAHNRAKYELLHRRGRG